MLYFSWRPPRSPSLPTHTTDLIHTLQVHLPELRQAYGVRTLGVFGSHVRGEARLDSDLDVLVEFDEQRPLSLFQFANWRTGWAICWGCASIWSRPP